MLEAIKTKHVVVPALNFPINTVEDGERFGYPRSKAEEAGYKREVEAAILAMREMHRRGIVVLPGGYALPPIPKPEHQNPNTCCNRDYGFAWTPHGTYARDLAHFTNLLGFTPHEAIIAATAGVAKLFMREHELGRIQPGYYADCILVNGDPLEDIEILQDHDKLNVIMINGRVHKASRKEYLAERQVTGGNGNGTKRGLDDAVELPEVKRVMQKNY